MAHETQSIVFTAPLDIVKEQGSRSRIAPVLTGFLLSLAFGAHVCYHGLSHSESSVSLRLNLGVLLKGRHMQKLCRWEFSPSWDDRRATLSEKEL